VSGGGPPRSSRYSGAYGQFPIGRLTSHHFSWCTVQRLCCPPNYSTGPPRVQAYQPDEAEQTRRDAGNLLEESRDVIVSRSARYQQTLWRYHAQRVHPRAFQVGDLVLHQVQTKKGKHKLTSLWEEPYFVAEVIRLGVYRLQEINGTTFPNAWNI
jgi:hypothetical protein